MKSTGEQPLTGCIEMEWSYLNLFDCCVLNEKPFVRTPWGQRRVGFICGHVNTVKCPNQEDTLNEPGLKINNVL